MEVAPDAHLPRPTRSLEYERGINTPICHLLRVTARGWFRTCFPRSRTRDKDLGARRLFKEGSPQGKEAAGPSARAWSLWEPLGATHTETGLRDQRQEQEAGCWRSRPRHPWLRAAAQAEGSGKSPWVESGRLWPPAQGEEVTRGHGRGPHSAHSASDPHGRRLA